MTIRLDMRVEAEIAGIGGREAEICRRALQAAADRLDVTGEISCLITSDEEMQALNEQWRGKDKPTDVLSFPAGEIDKPFLGDIAIGAGVMARDAETAGKTPEAHLSHLAVHGFLHLLGYDHIEDTDAETMEALEREALALIGLSDPYETRS